MTDLPNDPLDDAFARQLRRLNPATASAEGRSRGALTVETLLYQAGYRAAVAEREAADQRQMHAVKKNSGSRRLSNWMPVIAASLLTAVLTLPFAYQMGRGSTDTSAPMIADHREPMAIPIKQPRSEQPDIQSPPSTRPHDSPLAPKTTVRPIPIVSLASVLQPVWTLPEPSTETLTAFNIPSLDSIPRSGWIAMEDELMAPQETMSAGDLGRFTIGLQVNPR